MISTAGQPCPHRERSGWGDGQGVGNWVPRRDTPVSVDPRKKPGRASQANSKPSPSRSVVAKLRDVFAQGQQEPPEVEAGEQLCPAAGDAASCPTPFHAGMHLPMLYSPRRESL